MGYNSMTLLLLLDDAVSESLLSKACRRHPERRGRVCSPLLVGEGLGVRAEILRFAQNDR